MIALLLSSLLLLSGRANAADTCSAVDLRSLLGPPMHQGDSGYCFAHSASSLIEARTGFRASPMALAVGYILTNPEELSGAVDPALRAKLTPEFFAKWRKDRNEDPENLTPERIFTPEGLIDTGGQEEPTVIVANFRGLCPESRLPTGKDVYGNYLQSIRAFHEERVKRGVAPEGPIGEILGEESQAKAWSFRHWTEDRCGTPVPLHEPLLADTIALATNLKELRRKQHLLLATTLRLEQNRVMDAVNLQLDRGNPVAIGYALGDLMPDEVVEAGDAPRPEDHASVFAARKLMGGRCYYYLRNSFGQERSGYLASLRQRFEDGGVWVLPEEIPSLYSAVWLR